MTREEIEQPLSKPIEEEKMSEEQSQTDVKIRRLIPIPDFNKYHPDPTSAPPLAPPSFHL
jgi:hypothetical protein